MYTPRPAAITKYATRNVYRRNSETSGVVVDDAKSPEGAADPTVEFIVMYPRQVFLDRDGQQIVYEDWNFRVSQR
jgi:hypothetical protein